MKTSITTLSVLLCASGLCWPLMADDFTKVLQSGFQAHCLKCHGQGEKSKAELDLRVLKSAADLEQRPQLIEKLITVLTDRDMPPKDEPPVPDDQRRQMISWLKVTQAKVLKSQPFGITPIRRMNRFQYNNAVVDLLELDRDLFRLNERLMRRRQDYFRPETRKMPPEVRVSSRPLSKDIDNQRPEGFRGVSAFPQDKRAEHGFDNRADHLTLSPLLMESFLRLSQTIVESPDLNPKECRSWDRLFAEPGTSARSRFDGRYEAEVGGPIKIVGKPAGRAASQNMLVFGKQWSGNAQLFWICPKQDLNLTVSFTAKQSGTGLRFGFTKARDYGAFNIYLDDKQIGKTIDLYDPKVILTQHEVPANISDGPHTLRFHCVGKNDASVNHFFGLDYVEVTGGQKPGNATPPTTAPSAASAVAEIRARLKKLLRRGFRRPVDPETLERFTQFAQRQLAAGASFEDTMRTVVGAIIGMPDFLYFYETIDGGKLQNKAGGRQPIDDFELASRLSQFFWSSIPDDTLLDLAEQGKLSDRATLGAQIDRMLNDRRTSRFCDNFPAQWLQLDRLITSIPDPQKFPYFYYHGYRTSMHMLSEPLLLFETIYIEDRSIIDLLDPKFTWQSDMLRANYEGKSQGPHQVNVQVFKRVPLTDPRRGGVITNAAVMTMTSTPTRTQPITRGAWVNAVIFNDPPEPPPADVPALPEADAEKLAKLTIRERLAEHRKRADCAGCHNKIDPFGFALENFGPTGVWRDTYENGRQVDPSGILFNQHKFQTLVEFKRLILEDKQRFIRAFVSHLLSYALGRELGPADAPALDAMTEQALTGKDQMRTVLKSVAMSDPFLHKNTQAPADRNQQSAK